MSLKVSHDNTAVITYSLVQRSHYNNTIIEDFIQQNKDKFQSKQLKI